MIENTRQTSLELYGTYKSHIDVWQRLYKGALEREKKIFDREKRLHATIYSHPVLNTVHYISKSDRKHLKGLTTPRYVQLYAAAMRKIKVNNESRKVKALNAVNELNKRSHIRPTTSVRCNMLYDLSQEKQIIGKMRREKIYQKRALGNNPTKVRPHDRSKQARGKRKPVNKRLLRFPPVLKEDVRTLSEQNKKMSAKAITVVSRSALTKNTDFNVLREPTKNNRFPQKEKIHQSKASTNNTCSRVKSKVLNQSEGYDKDPAVGLSSRISYLYESGKQKIRLKRSRNWKPKDKNEILCRDQITNVKKSIKNRQRERYEK